MKVWRRTETGEASRRQGATTENTGSNREYLREEQRSQRGCIARRMQPDFHHGLLELATVDVVQSLGCGGAGLRLGGRLIVGPTEKKQKHGSFKRRTNRILAAPHIGVGCSTAGSGSQQQAPSVGGATLTGSFGHAGKSRRYAVGEGPRAHSSVRALRSRLIPMMPA